ncbi:MAG TPA: S-adenosylmethionine--2-demethylmenaquinone methyltransferase, partial [Clostridiales bacterium]|nr:S-adenosylmethionine--2-demethylmenaquinone methyltransferase [Clostridiales bacterium]
MSNIVVEINRPDENDIVQVGKFSTATLHEAAGKKGAL